MYERHYVSPRREAPIRYIGETINAGHAASKRELNASEMENDRKIKIHFAQFILYDSRDKLEF